MRAPAATAAADRARPRRAMSPSANGSWPGQRALEERARGGGIGVARGATSTDAVVWLSAELAARAPGPRPAGHGPIVQVAFSIGTIEGTEPVGRRRSWFSAAICLNSAVLEEPPSPSARSRRDRVRGRACRRAAAHDRAGRARSSDAASAASRSEPALAGSSGGRAADHDRLPRRDDRGLARGARRRRRASSRPSARRSRPTPRSTHRRFRVQVLDSAGRDVRRRARARASTAPRHGRG